MKKIDEKGREIPQKNHAVELLLFFKDEKFEIINGYRDETSNTSYFDVKMDRITTGGIIISELEIHEFEMNILGKEMKGIMYVIILRHNAIKIIFKSYDDGKQYSLLLNDDLFVYGLKITTLRIN